MEGGVMTTGLRHIVGEPLRATRLVTQQGFHRVIGGAGKIVRHLPGALNLSQRRRIASGVFGAASPPTSR